MEKLQTTGDILKKAAGITLIGFLVVVLFGPLVALAGALIPFALVGLLVYIPYRLFMIGKNGGWSAIRQTAGQVFRKILFFPLWVLGWVFAAVRFVLRTFFGLIRMVLSIVLLVGGGAAAGAILGTIGGMEFHDADMRAPAGALIGAAIGLLAWLWPARRSRPALVVQPVPQLQRVHV